MIINYLPLAVRQGSSSAITKALTVTYDNYLTALLDYWENYQTTIIDPMQMDEKLLDITAMMPLNPWRVLWDISWNIQTKRLLLRDTNIIFQRRLFPETLTLLFAHFNLKAKIKYTSGWVLSVSSIPARLGANLFEYTISIPPSYNQGSLEFQLTRWICENFGSPKQFIYIFE